jgi:hypothetical protein
MSNTPAPEPTEPLEKPKGFLAGLRGIGIIPAVVISCIALVAVGNLGFLLKRVVANHGLMPRPTAMQTYACKGFPQPFSLDFRHGMDSVQLHYQTVLLDGNLLNGKIQWIGLPAVAAQLGFVPPTEITYDDSSSLRVLDQGQVERICQRAQ